VLILGMNFCGSGLKPAAGQTRRWIMRSDSMRGAIRCSAAVTLGFVISVYAAVAQTVPAPEPVALTLKKAIDLALQNSKDIQVAKIQASVADHAAMINKAQFLPNFYAGSGAGYSYGIPETPGGRAPAVFSVTYNEQVLNEPLRGVGREQQEQARAQKIILEDVRNSVIVRVASAYLELVKVRHSAELLEKESASAEKILGVVQQRSGEGLELPIELTKAQLTKAQVAQRLLQLQGRDDELETFLRAQCGLAPEQQIEATPEELPGAAEQEGADLVAMAMQDNTDLRLARSDVQAKQFRLTGEKRSYWPTLQFVSIYSLLSKYNNYNLYFNHFQRNNYNAGIQAQIPIFSAGIKANIGFAESNLAVAKATLATKQNQVNADVRRRTRKVREAEAGKEVARLELQLQQQNLAQLQARFEEGQAGLQEVEKARLDENEKWMALLDATFQRQQAQLDLLKTAGQLDKVLQ
jgi:outer membrane protein TolC